jgi:hypothetical protein
MKTPIILAVLALAFSAKAYPADPKDDVELVPPKITNVGTVSDADDSTTDDDDKTLAEIPVIIIRTRPFFSRRPSFFGPPASFDRNFGFGGGFPFGGFPFSGSSSGSSSDDDDVDDDIFGFGSDDRRTSQEGVTDSDDSDDGKEVYCGFLCSILKNLEDHFKDVVVRRNETSKDGFDIFNETYTEKTLADGTVVKINKTVIADTSDDGNSFFFHSSTFHHPGFGFGKEYPDEEEEDIEHEFTEEKKEQEDETVEDGNVELTTSGSPSTTTTTFGLVPKIDDEEEAFNDIFADVDKTKTSSESNKGIDDGLVTIEAVQK